MMGIRFIMMGMVIGMRRMFAGDEGVYLKGFGVVYNLSLPITERAARPRAAKPAPPTATEWERVRRQLRGEKADAEPKTGAAKNPMLADRVLKILADNGHHFTRLRKDEQITVVVNFPAGASGQAPNGRMNWTTTNTAAFQDGKSGGSLAGLITSGQFAPSEAGAGGGDATPSDITGVREKAIAALQGIGTTAKASSAQDYSLLGDLHMKQGRPQDAKEAYEKALAKKPAPKDAALLRRKLARAYLSLDVPDEENLRSLEANLKKAEELVREAEKEYRQILEQGRKPTTKAAPPPAPRPAKLIISATKYLLDQVGTGKISVAEFERLASVEYLSFTK
jgi:tetratricopeptide (TPR) repeat protein